MKDIGKRGMNSHYGDVYEFILFHVEPEYFFQLLWHLQCQFLVQSPSASYCFYVPFVRRKSVCSVTVNEKQNAPALVSLTQNHFFSVH